jgi:hypothetical protein
MLRLRRRLLWLIRLRVAIVTVLFGAGVLVSVRSSTTWTSDPFFVLLGLLTRSSFLAWYWRPAEW